MAVRVQTLLMFLFVAVAESHLLTYPFGINLNHIVEGIPDLVPSHQQPHKEKQGLSVPYVPIPYTNTLDLLHHIFKPDDESLEQSSSDRGHIFTYDKTPDDEIDSQNSLENDDLDVKLVYIDKRKHVTDGETISDHLNTLKNTPSNKSVPYYILFTANGQTGPLGRVNVADLQKEDGETNSLVSTVEPDRSISNKALLVFIKNALRNSVKDLPPSLKPNSIDTYVLESEKSYERHKGPE